MLGRKNRSIRLAAATSAALVIAGLAATAGPASASVNIDPVREFGPFPGSGPIFVSGGFEVDAAGTTYLAAGSQIQVYAPTATDPYAPTKVITDFDDATSISEGPQGVAVADVDRIVVFNKSQADGAVDPIREISGPDTGLDDVISVAWSSNGSLWALDVSGDPKLVHFPAGAHDNAVPDRVISGSETGLRTAAYGLGSGPGASIATQPDGAVVVPDMLANKIHVFGPAQNGNRRAARTIRVLSSSPSDNVTGVDTDGAGRIYATVANLGSLGGGADWGHLDVYARNANGSATPIQQLTGNRSGLALVLMPRVTADGSIALLNGRLLISSSFSLASILYFDPLDLTAPVAVKAPGAVHAIKVKRVGNKRRITWAAPVANGGAAITKYRVVITKGKKVVRRASTTHRKLRPLAIKLPKGKLKVTIRAVNKAGAGAAASKTFRK